VECVRCHELFHEECLEPGIVAALHHDKDPLLPGEAELRGELLYLCADCSGKQGRAVYRDECPAPPSNYLACVERERSSAPLFEAKAVANRERGMIGSHAALETMGRLKALRSMELRSYFDLHFMAARPISLCTMYGSQTYVIGTMPGSLIVRSHAEATPSRLLDMGWAVTALSSIGHGHSVVAAGGWDGDVALIDLELMRMVSCASLHRHVVTSTAFDCNASPVMATASRDKTVKLVDWRTARRGCPPVLLARHTAEVAGARFLDDTCVVSAGGDACVKLWDVRRPGVALAMIELDGPATSVDVAAHRVAINTTANEVMVLDSTALTMATIGSSVPVTRLVGHDNDLWRIGSARLDPTGTSVAAGSEDGSVCVWHVDSGELVRRIHAHSGCVWDVAWLDDVGLALHTQLTRRQLDMASVSDDGAVCRFGLACPTPQGEWHRGQRVLARSGDGVYHHATVTHLLPPGDGRRCGEAAAVKYRAAGWGSEGPVAHAEVALTVTQACSCWAAARCCQTTQAAGAAPQATPTPNLSDSGSLET